MNIEQERAEFEAWAVKERIAYRDEKNGLCFYNGQRHSYWFAYQAGRAAVQSQDRSLSHLEKDRIATAAHVKASAIPGATFYNAAKFALDGVKTREDSQWCADDVREFRCIGKAINRAAMELPEGWGIRIGLELGAGTVYLSGPDGTETMIDMSGELFSDQISAAIDHARRVEGGEE